VDVRATNAKLRERALAIVERVTGLDRAAAEALLATCDGEAKTAILVARTRVAPPAARARLAAHGGRLRAALEESAAGAPGGGAAS